MDISANTLQQFEQASIYSDLNSLNDIRKLGLSDKEGALKKASKEFEAFFLNIMLKSMRQATAVIGEGSPMSSPQEKMYIGMLDEQMAVELSQKGLLGISDLLMQQLSPSNKQSEIRSTSFLPDRAVAKGIEKPIVLPTEVNKVIVHKSNKVIDAPQEYKVAEDPKIAEIKSVSNNLVEPEKKALFDDALEFVKTLLPHAKKAAKLLNLDPRLLLAQAALETGWGKFIMHDESGQPGFNLFGIKAEKSWQGGTINIDTLEVENQSFKKIKAAFRKYDGFAESFKDYIQFVQKNPRYQSALENSDDPKEYINQLQTSGYATDPNYANKIMRIFHNKILQSLDSTDLSVKDK